MYRFAFRGRWLVGHVLVLLLAGLFVRLGVWQLHRHDEKRALGDRIESRMDAPPAALPAALAGGPEAAEYRRVTVEGSYDGAGQVAVRNRSRDGVPGRWVLTPLRLGDGRAVIVNRGWLPATGTDPGAGLPPPPGGDVRVTGVVRTGEVRGRFGARDPAGGRLATLSRVDLDRLDRQVPGELLPVYVQLREQAPAPAPGGPRPLELPDVGDGPHLPYAVQWFSFAAVGLVGWPLLLRRMARPGGRRGDAGAAPEPHPARAGAGPG